uniref:Secreted protein n=1 Tax=Opuntia streptacantha TaxID=393608 RepID=A0A7C9EPL1_OPUST
MYVHMLLLIYSVCLIGLAATQCPQSFGSFLLSSRYIQQKCGASVERFTCQCRTCMGRDLLVQSHHSLNSSEKNCTMNLLSRSTGGRSGICVHRRISTTLIR